MSPRLVAAALVAVASAAGAQDLERGRALYETHCVQCHAERLHERGASIVHDMDGLRAQVERWARQTGQRFSAMDVEDVAQYLNATHYRFKPAAGPTSDGRR
jgi:mono/diheme cytochrome c family protein